MTRAPLTAAVPVAVCLLLACLPVHAQNADFTSGVAKVQQGDYDGAIADLQKTVAAQPRNETAWYYLGVAQFQRADAQKGDLDGAMQALTRAVGLAPLRPGTRLYLGRVHEARGELDKATLVYQEEAAMSRGLARADALVALGRVYIRQGKPEAAVDVLKQALTIDTKYVEALYQTGLAYASMKRYKDAISAFDKAQKVLDEWSVLKIRLQRVNPIRQRAEGETPEDLAQVYGKAEEFATQQGLWPELNKARGDAYLGDSQWAEARNAYRHALKRAELGNPSDPDVFTRIAKAYLNDAAAMFTTQDRMYGGIAVLKSAVRNAEAALEIDPQYAPAHRVLGLVFAFEANNFTSDLSRGIIAHTYDDAIKQFQKALQIEPDSYDTLVDLGATYLDWAARLTAGSADQNARYAAAGILLERAAQLRPGDTRAQAELARLAFDTERYEEALRLAQSVLVTDKNNVSALNTAGLASYYMGANTDAVRYFTAAIELDEKQHQAYTNLGNAFYQLQSWFRAREQYRKALDRLPTAKAANTASQRAYLYYLMAITYHETRMYDQEIEALNQAIATDGNYFEAYRQLGRAYADKGDWRAAAQALEIATDKAPDDLSEADVYAQLGQMYERAGDVHKAAAAYANALGLDPNSVVARQALERLQG